MKRGSATAAAAAIGFVTTGALAAGWLGDAPEALRVLVACTGLIVAPALMGMSIVAARAPVSQPWASFPLCTLAVLSAHALVAEASTRAGISLSGYTNLTVWILLAGYGVACLASFRRWIGPPRHGARRFIATALAVAALASVALITRPTLTTNEDALDHIGYVRRAVAEDSMRPDGVLAPPVDAGTPLPPDPRKGSLHALLAAITTLSASDAATTWVWFPLVIFPVAVLAFGVFASAFVGTGPMLAACMGLFALSYGGTVLQFAPTSAYGQNLAATWYWMLAAIAMGAAAHGLTRVRVATLALLGAGGTLVHLGVALHAFVLAGSLVFFGGMARMPRGPRVRVAIVLVVSTAVAAFERLAGARGSTNEIHAHLQGVMEVGRGWFVASPMEILREHGMVFLGGIALLPFLVPAARRLAPARLTLAMSLLPCAIVFVPWFATPLFERTSYMLFRVLLNAPVIPVVVWVMAWGIGHARAGGTPRRVLASFAMALWAIVFFAPAWDAFATDARQTARARTRTRVAAGALVAWARALPPQSTILSDPATSYALSAFTTNHFVALLEQHANPYDPCALDRLEAVRDALSPFAVADIALSACHRYRVDYVVVRRAPDGGEAGFLSGWSPALYEPTVRRMDSMRASFVRVFETPGAVAFRFRPGGVVEHRAEDVVRPVVVASPSLEPCGAPVPGDVFRITGVSVSPARVAPGDSIVVTLGYRRDAPTAFGFPSIIHLRLDHASVNASPRYPGEKYVRRARERWSGSFVRFRTDVRPGHGVYEPDLWPMGVDLCERFAVVVPRVARPGVYRLEVKVERESLLPNFHIDDLLFNRDHYSGVTCGALNVVAAGEPPGEDGAP